MSEPISPLIVISAIVNFLVIVGLGIFLVKLAKKKK